MRIALALSIAALLATSGCNLIAPHEADPADGGVRDLAKLDEGQVDAEQDDVDSPPDTEPTCEAPYKLCDGACKDVLSDHEHCGDCWEACGPLQQCVNGSCVCLAGQTPCGTVCINLDSNDDNCGACGSACGAGESCEKGICCPAGEINCFGVCSNTQIDVSNCGSCSNICSNSCVQGVCAARIKRVFVTSDTYSGMIGLGGISGADIACHKRATDELLGGTWKAWISTSVSWPAQPGRFNTDVGRYVLVDGATVVAEGWTALTDGTLDHAIDMDEKMGTQAGPVWTNTKFNGQLAGQDDCAGWMNGLPSAMSGAIGECSTPGVDWSETQTTIGCEGPARLYCFEQ